MMREICVSLIVLHLIRYVGDFYDLRIFIVFVNKRKEIGIEILLMHAFVFFEQFSDSLLGKNAFKKIEMFRVIVNSVVKKSLVVHNVVVKIKKSVLL
jgi:hypothetical protein